MSNRLWVNQDDEIVHPDSPRGVGGPGSFTGAVPSLDDVDIFTPPPHPDSPAGRLYALNDHHKQQLIQRIPAGRIQRPGAAAKKGELNLYGQFAPGPWKSGTAVLAAINSKTDDWFPGKDELYAFAKSGAGAVEGVANVWNLLCAIARHHPSRVNIFTHAVNGYIGLSGRVVKGDVIFSPDSDAEFSAEVISNADDEGFTFSDSSSKNVRLKDVRNALSKNAIVVIYACHAGLDKDYLQKIANALRVTVKGFADEIRYHPVVRSEKISWLYSVGSSQKVSDFHSLDKFATEINPSPAR